MTEYIIPNGDEIEFDFLESYSIPEGDNIIFNFAPSLNLDLDLESTPFISSNIVFADVFIIINCESFSMLSQCSTGMLWSYPLSPLENTNELFCPSVLVDLLLPEFCILTSITLTTQQRIKLVNFGLNSYLNIKGVVVVQENYEVISTWPFESKNILIVPDLYHSLFIDSFKLESYLDTPFITACETSVLDAPPFQSHITFDLSPLVDISVESFLTNQTLSINYIKSMPVDDNYIGMVPFAVEGIIKEPLIQSGIPLTSFELSNSFEFDVFSGTNVDCEPMQVSTSLLNTILVNIDTAPFAQLSAISVSLQSQLPSPTFDLTSTIECSVYTMDFVSAKPFNQESRLGLPELNVELSLVPLTSQSDLRSEIGEFISLLPFESSTELSISRVYNFTIDLASVYYFFTLTGAENGITDIEIPISSVQARKRNGAPSYLQVVIPGTEKAGEIVDRADGKIQVHIGYKLDGEIVRKELVLEGNLESIRVDEGLQNSAITLIGYKTENYTPKTVEIKGITYKNMINGKQLYRFAVFKTELSPGDTVLTSDSTFVSDYISYYFNATKNGINQNMEVSEA